MNDIVVIGGNHHNTLGVIRSLGEVGLPISLILITKERNPFVSYSRYLKKVILIENSTLLLDALLSKCRPNNGKSVVICCSDTSSSAVDLHKNMLSTYFILPGADEQGRITTIMNKSRMAELAVAVGFDIPLSFSVEEISFPCIIKPLVSKDGSKDEIHICYNREELEKALVDVEVGRMQIQQYIEKDFEYQLIGCSTGAEVVIPGVSKILRPCKGSNTSFLHYTPFDNNFCDIEKTKEFVRRTGYKGLFSIEFLRDKNGKDYFMEMNFRNDGNAICVTESGINLPYIWYLSCIGEDYTKELRKKIKSCYVMPDWAEFKLLLHKEISLKEYISDFMKTNRFMEFDRRDPKPFFRMLWNKII